jgi:transposase
MWTQDNIAIPFYFKPWYNTNMAYSKDTREMVLSYLAKGHTYEEARAELGVGVSTIKSWKRLLNETGSLEKRSKQRSASRFYDEELKAYVKDNPDATLEEIAKHFGGSVSGAHDALARLEISFKKRAFLH